jgi:enoyl-CoA hydratase/carnithine racemase
MTKKRAPAGRINVEARGPVLIGRLDGGPRGEFGPDIADDLRVLVDRVDSDTSIKAVVLTGTHPGRFVGHAELRWLQEGGAATPSVGRGAASAIVRTASAARRTPGLNALASMTPLGGAMQLDRLHETFLRMNCSGAIYVAALNGSALGIGSELAQACDLRLMADGDFFIGQPEVLLGFNPGGGGTQRLTRLVGAHRALMIMLEGRPLPPQKALEIGYIDEVVPPGELLDRAIAMGNYLGSRSRDAIIAIKRSVYLGGSKSLEEGLHVENTEFLKVLPTKHAQDLMLGYMERTVRDGDLPLYNPTVYAEALERGHVPASSGAAKK